MSVKCVCTYVVQDKRNINRDSKAASVFQLIGLVSTKYIINFYLKGKLNDHIDIELKHVYHDDMIIRLILKAYNFHINQ